MSQCKDPLCRTPHCQYPTTYPLPWTNHTELPVTSKSTSSSEETQIPSRLEEAHPSQLDIRGPLCQAHQIVHLSGSAPLKRETTPLEPVEAPIEFDPPFLHTAPNTQQYLCMKAALIILSDLSFPPRQRHPPAPQVNLPHLKTTSPHRPPIISLPLPSDREDGKTLKTLQDP